MPKHLPKHSVEKKAAADVKGQGKPHLVTPRVRYLAWRREAGDRNVPGVAQEHSIDTDITMPKEFTTVKVELFEKGHDETPLVTLEGDGSSGMFVATKLTRAKLDGVPVDKHHDLYAPVYFMASGLDGNGPGRMMTLVKVPLRGHQDYADESWEIYLKVTAAGQVVQDDPELDSVHLWINWVEGAVAFPMLGAPAIVEDSSKWLECLVATRGRIPVVSEKFFILSQLRLYAWGKGDDPAADEKVRQKALAKRTFDLYDDASVELAPYMFDDLGSDVDKDKDPSFKMKLGFLQHWTRADMEYANERDRAATNKLRAMDSAGADGPPVMDSLDTFVPTMPADAPVVLPGLGPDSIPASKVNLYKVRLKLKEGPGLYDLVWMNGSDFHQANKVAVKWTDPSSGKVKDKVHLSQDARLRQTLHLLLTGDRLSHDPNDPDSEAGAAQDEKNQNAWRPSAFRQSCMTYTNDGHPQQDSGDPWKPSRNFLNRVSDLAGFRAYHPVSVVKGPRFEKIGHLTDIHLDARLDVMAQIHTLDGKDPLKLIPDAAPAEVRSLPLADLINNYNATFFDLASRFLKSEADALVLTGDLTDYNRGFAAPPDPGSAASGFDAHYTWRVLGGDKSFTAYKTGRNWALFYAQIVALYTKYHKPIFTILGNHDYRPVPYGIYPGMAMVHPYDTLAGDLNMTIFESIALYGPEPGGIRVAEIGKVLATQDLMDLGLLDTESTAPRWYDHVINGWKDFYAFRSDQSLILLDWDVDEDNLEPGTQSWENVKGTFRGRKEGHDTGWFHLPRAKRFMTQPQRDVYRRLVEEKKAPGPWRVLCTHPTLACNNPKVSVTNAEAREGVELADVWWGSMGESSIFGTSDGDTASKTRHMVQGHLGDKTLRLSLHGHSHMDGVYQVKAGDTRVYMLWPKPASHSGPPWQPGDPVPPGACGPDLEMGPVPKSVDQCAVVSNSGGPCGEYIERTWTRRSPPSGNVFGFDGSTITMKHIASQRPSAIPRRCVHDAERERIEHGVVTAVYRADYNLYDPPHRFDAPGPVSAIFAYLLDKEEPKLNALRDLYLVIHTADDQWHYERSDILMRKEDADGSSWRQKCWVAFTKEHIERSAPWRFATKPPLEVFLVLRYPECDPRHDWVMPVEVEVSEVVTGDEGRRDRPSVIGDPNLVVTSTTRIVSWKILQQVPWSDSHPRWKTSG
jgi:hypothetical protein